MNIRDSNFIHDTTLITWIESSWKERRKEYISLQKRTKSCTDEAQIAKNNRDRDKLLLALAQMLRQYINSVRAKRGNVLPEFKDQAHTMIEWLQKELLTVGWTPNNNVVLQSIQYGRKCVGNAAIEGKALTKPVSAADKRRTEQLRRAAAKRADSSLEQFVTQDADDSTDGRDDDLQPDLATLD
jgi:hypothetical protein